MIPGVRAAVRELGPNLPILAIRSLESIVSTSIAERRFEMLLTTVFAVSALLLGTMGVYGMAADSVARQTREIGLRMVFGATPRNVLSRVLMRGLRAVIAGMLAGVWVATAIAISLRSLLFGAGRPTPLHWEPRK